jgi:MoaA/NifB/PqqE/SkfB family radical SAM enzyme
MNVKILAKRASFVVGNKVRRAVGMKPRHKLIVQIELAGKCSATCEFCDWMRRPKEQMTFMETALAKKAVKEAKELNADYISFHVTGESLDHPDLFEILPNDGYIGISTNCLSLTGETADKLSKMRNLNLILAVLWAEPEEKRNRSLANAIAFLDKNPQCADLSVQMITSEHSVPHAKFMYDTFSPYLNKLDQLRLFYKQPYVQEYEDPYLGYVPEGVPESKRVCIDRMTTPQSCGSDCLAISPNPMSSMLVQVDGEIKPCFYRPNDPLKKKYAPTSYQNGWGMGNIRNTTLKQFWNSAERERMLKIWAKGDPYNKLPCYNCIRMAVPRGSEKTAWWLTTGIPPKTLDCHQALKGGTGDPYPQPDE